MELALFSKTFKIKGSGMPKIPCAILGQFYLLIQAIDN
jgi:hypothetical protein